MGMSIEATVVVPGLHHWPDAHEARSYLRTPHRHLFHVTAEVRVADDDRAVEWHDLAYLLANTVTNLADAKAGGLYDFGPRSCETLARAAARDLDGHHLTVLRVSVSEDGEFTAHYRPTVVHEQS